MLFYTLKLKLRSSAKTRAWNIRETDSRNSPKDQGNSPTNAPSLLQSSANRSRREGSDATTAVAAAS